MTLNAHGPLRGLLRWFGRVRGPLPPIAPIDVGETGSRFEPISDTPPVPARTGRINALRVFDPAHPVESRTGLFGREQELEDLLEATLTLGQHVVIHGARGSGKTSLVRVFGDHADQRGALVLYTAAEPNSSFADLMRPFLVDIPASLISPAGHAAFERLKAELHRDFRPRGLVDAFSYISGGQAILILDEFDRVENDGTKSEIAGLMKMLSDTLSNVQLVLVGIAGNVTEMIGSHPSLRRHMRPIPVGRISPAGVKDLIDNGEQALGIGFTVEARQLIEGAAFGSPYHVRLFCSHSASAALRNGAHVDREMAVHGLNAAIRAWKSTNEEDVLVFSRAMLRGNADALMQIASVAGRADGSIDPEAATVSRGELELLRDSLVAVPGRTGVLAFRDSAAPQFLAAMILTRGTTGQSPALEIRVAGREW